MLGPCHPLMLPPCLDFRKCLSGSQTALSIQGADSIVLLINDDNDNITHLIDTSTETSIISCTLCLNNRHDPPLVPSQKLFAANGSIINSCGSLDHTIQFKGHGITASFILAVVQRLIMGADFIQKHRLLVDIFGCRLLLPSLSASIPCTSSGFPSCNISQVSSNSSFLHKRLTTIPHFLSFST